MAVMNQAGGRDWRRLLAGIIVIHLLLVFVSILPFASGLPNYLWPRGQCIFIESLACSQIGLLASLLALGGMLVSLRICALAVVVAFWLTALNYLGLGHEYWFTIFAIQISVVGAFFLAARLFGVRTRNEYITHEKEQEIQKAQISLQQMMWWVAAVACLLNLGLVAWYPFEITQPLDLGMLWRATPLGIGLACVTVTAVWAALGSNRELVTIFVTIFVTVVVSLFIGTVDRIHRTTWWSSLNRETYEVAYWYLVFLHSTLVYCSSLALRVCGYRIDKAPIRN